MKLTIVEGNTHPDHPTTTTQVDLLTTPRVQRRLDEMLERYNEERRQAWLRWLELWSDEDLLKPAPGRGCGYSKFSAKGRARRS